MRGGRSVSYLSFAIREDHLKSTVSDVLIISGHTALFFRWVFVFLRELVTTRGDKTHAEPMLVKFRISPLTIYIVGFILTSIGTNQSSGVCTFAMRICLASLGLAKVRTHSRGGRPDSSAHDILIPEFDLRVSD